jgi:hypothetical protein
MTRKKLPPIEDVDVLVRRDALAWRYELYPKDGGPPLDLSEYRFGTEEAAKKVGQEALDLLYAPRPPKSSKKSPKSTTSKPTKRTKRHK